MLIVLLQRLLESATRLEREGKLSAPGNHLSPVAFKIFSAEEVWYRKMVAVLLQRILGKAFI